MKKTTLFIASLLLVLGAASAYIQNGTYYQIDYGDNEYLDLASGTTTGGGGGGGRVDLTEIEQNIDIILARLGNDSDSADLLELIIEIQNNTEKIRNLTAHEISEMNKKITELFAEKKGLYLTTLSQPIYLELYPREYTQSMVMIKNTRNETSHITAKVNGRVEEFINIENPSVTLNPTEEGYINLSIYILPETSPGLYYGNIVMESINLTSMLPVNIRVLESREQILNIKVTPLSDRISPGDKLRVSTTLYNLGAAGGIDVSLTLQLIDPSTNNIITEEIREVRVETETTTITELNVSSNIREGKYVIRGIARFSREGGKSQEISIAYVEIRRSFFQWILFGFLPVWLLITLLIIALGSYVGFILYQREQAKKKRYLEKLELRTLPQPGPRAGFVGRLAETAIRGFWNIDKLNTHVLVAGATGSGKTVASQILVEEALKKNAAVIVFDPTAQWTGFLRKNTDKGMFNLYPKFGMKEKDAQSFNGNIHIIKDASERIDIKKHISPGEINIFCLNNLETPEIDSVVRNSIQDAFMAGFEETYELKALVIYDEVHRLLPKFGGSGTGLTQIEHAVREFRKWGLGVILVSQVLSDFVGEIKANVGTEIQLRTRYEDDLERIKMKYGEDILKSVVKASVGTAMIQNAEYNKGRPYFITFRPPLHNLPRLTDKELNLYDEFNTQLDGLRKKIEELKEAQIDVFDIEIELNLAFDNVKKGAFDVAKMYLETLEPRINSTYDDNKKRVEKAKEGGPTVKGKPRIQKMQARNIDVIERLKELKEKREGGKEEVKGSREHPAVAKAVEHATREEAPKETREEAVGGEAKEEEKQTETREEEVENREEEAVEGREEARVEEKPGEAREEAAVEEAKEKTEKPPEEKEKKRTIIPPLDKELFKKEVEVPKEKEVKPKEEHKKIKEKIEGRRKEKPTEEVSKIGRQVVNSEETQPRGPQIKKVVSRKDSKIFVYLTVKNNRRTPLRNVQIVDNLPEDAKAVDVITHEDLQEQTPKAIKWAIPNLGMHEKRILHYTLETKLSGKLPLAELSWTEREEESWEDVKDVWKAIKEKKGKV